MRRSWRVLAGRCRCGDHDTLSWLLTGPVAVRRTDAVLPVVSSLRGQEMPVRYEWVATYVERTVARTKARSRYLHQPLKLSTVARRRDLLDLSLLAPPLRGHAVSTFTARFDSDGSGRLRWPENRTPDLAFVMQPVPYLAKVQQRPNGTGDNSVALYSCGGCST